MGCPGNPRLAFQLQHELWALPEKQGPDEGLVPPPVLFVSSLFSEVGASEI